LTSLTADACDNVLDAILNQAPASDPVPKYQWLLMHCDSGVVWGRFESGGWRLSSEAFPEISPAISANARKTVQQVRLFGKGGETLIWRVDRSKAAFLGRTIEDAPVEESKAPLNDRMLLIGDRVIDSKHGFSLIGDATGACHAVPVPAEALALPLALRVKHYFEMIEPSGSLRIGVTRLCGLG
jgi:CRISPR-associated protein (TIGR03984 family)